MIAKNNEYMEAMATSVCTLCNDPKFVEECERRLFNEWEYNSMMAELRPIYCKNRRKLMAKKCLLNNHYLFSPQ